MSLITIFTAPKPFTNPHINIIQRNAVRNWMALGSDVEVILIGNEEGMAQVAAEYGVKHLLDVRVSELGTPLISSIFQLARENSTSPLMMYVNADILLFPGIIDTARRLQEQAGEFLLVGQRWDLSIETSIDFSEGWPDRLNDDLQQRGQLHVPAGSDYFLFPRTLFTDVPDFAVGRAGWDNWMIYHGTVNPWHVIDGTPSVTIIHQDHDYSHLPGGKAHYDHVETKANAQLGGGFQNMYMILDTDREMVNNRIQYPVWRLERAIRFFERLIQPEGEVGSGLLWWMTRHLRRWRRKVVKGNS
ncbi:MAG: hypothetical protein JXA19_01940 [Anaerolineales bacterium]|nr:hypothetical protein [Anaerolineales bacterium]